MSATTGFTDTEDDAVASPPRSPWPGRLAGITGSGILLVLYARGEALTLLGFIALVPWLLSLNAERRAAGMVLNSLLMTATLVLGVFAWFGAALDSYLGIGGAASVSILVLLAPLLQPQLVAFAVVRHIAGSCHSVLLRSIAGASAWVACEWLYPKLLGDTLGHGLFPSATLRQAADLAGAAGLSFLLIVVNESLTSALSRWRQGPRSMAAPLALAALLVAATAGYGNWRLATLTAQQATPSASMRIGMVQANITDYERLRAEIGAYAVIRRVLDTHGVMSAHAVHEQGAEALLWSETVYPTTFGHPKSADGAALDREILGIVDQLGVPLVFGSYDLDAAGEYNAAAFVEPGRGLLGVYRKTFPFPLTEHVPTWLDGSALRRWLPWAGSWQRGDGARVLPLRTVDGRELNVLPLICLDAVQSTLAIDGARLGAQAIVVLSNDSWFTIQPHGARLHLAVSAFRSIETRLPQLRVTANGFSAIIDESGEILAQTEMNQQAVLVGDVPLRSPPSTLMVQWGDWLGRAAAVFLLGAAVIAAARRWRLRARPTDDRERRLDKGPYHAEVVLLTPAWRALIVGLRLVAAAGLGWLALRMLTIDGLQVNSLEQLRLFTCLVGAPMLAAWAVQRACAGRLQVIAQTLVLEQAHQRIEIPLSSITVLHAWKLPLPGAGLTLQLASGRRWPSGIQLADPAALQRVLAAHGSPARWAEGSLPLADFARMRTRSRHPWLDHAAIKFLLFPLLPALPAFRLHQVIAYGGTFGEYYTYGFTAWLGGLLIWWGAWALGLMLLAAALRVLVEAGTLFAVVVRPPEAAAARRALEWLARALFYLGAPTWLLLRMLGN